MILAGRVSSLFLHCGYSASNASRVSCSYPIDGNQRVRCKYISRMESRIRVRIARPAAVVAAVLRWHNGLPIALSVGIRRICRRAPRIRRVSICSKSASPTLSTAATDVSWQALFAQRMTSVIFTFILGVSCAPCKGLTSKTALCLSPCSQRVRALLLMYLNHQTLLCHSVTTSVDLVETAAAGMTRKRFSCFRTKHRRCGSIQRNIHDMLHP